MRGKKRIIYIVITLVALIASYLYVVNKWIPPQAPPDTIKENPPVVEKEMPNKKKEEETILIEKKPTLSLPSSASEKIERPATVSATREETVNLEEQSYSIHKEKKEISITPGVVLQPGKSINLKVGEDIIRVGRDKVYHPGGYNVLWEKKY